MRVAPVILPASRVAGALACVALLPLLGVPDRVKAQAPVLQPIAPEKVGLSRERLARVGRFLEAEIASGALPGAVVAVARHGNP